MFSTRTAKKKTTQSATEEMSRCPKCGEQVYYGEQYNTYMYNTVGVSRGTM